MASGERYTPAPDPSARAKELRQDSNKCFKESLELFEYALDMQPGDTEVLNGLVRITASLQLYGDSLAWGEALVADDNFSARYDLDRVKGIFSRPQHKLAGQSYVDKVLVLNTSKGGVASAWMLHEMKSRGMAPKAILFNTANTILAQGGALANLTMCDRFEGDVTTMIKTGEEVEVDPTAGTVTILYSSAPCP